MREWDAIWISTRDFRETSANIRSILRRLLQLRQEGERLEEENAHDDDLKESKCGHVEERGAMEEFFP